jgi:transposase InsO family protein
LQDLQQQVRQHVAAYVEQLQQAGLTWAACGALLQLAPRTLRYWTERGAGPLGLAPLGRPLTCAPLPVRQQILADLQLLGPGVGVPTLAQHFPGVARAELADLLACFRAVCRRRDRQPARVLHWQTPGRVWAVDFTEPSRYGAAAVLPPVAGCYPYVLAVRDLASGYLLAWQPVPCLTAEVTRAALAGLFGVHGAPLVLKMDNGSAFRAAELKQFLEAWGTIGLYSPPSCPGYNGAIEATIGSLKKRTEEQAAQHGRSGSWQLDDLSAAQAAANASHPRRLNGRTSTSVWNERHLLDALERVVFALTAGRLHMQARDELGIAPEDVLDHWRHSAVDRVAVERALVEHGHLLFTRRRIPLAIRTRKVTADV